MPKPVLLTVDDDPGVSRAVARDLRRRYGENYRVVRADSALDALERSRRSSAGANQSPRSWPITGCPS